MTLPRYPAYKDSGVEWLGEVPKHWTVMPLKRLVSLRSGEMINSSMIDETGGYPVFGGNGIRGFTSGFTHSGDFALIGRQGALCGNVNYAQGQFWASEHAIVVSPLKPTPTRWIGELLHAMNLNQYSTSAAQPGLSVDVIANISIPVPSREEQQIIANFLHHETSKIDALIAEQQNLIALLKEKRQAVISHAVTRGLNPDVPMKDSGVEWLGEVPKHWMARPLRSLAKSGPNTFIDGDWIESPYITDEGVRLIQTGNVGIGVYREQGFRFVSDETFTELGCTEVAPNDVLICRLADPVGRACLAPDLGCRMITSVDVCILKPRPDVSVKFVVHFASSSPYLAYLESQCRGGTRDRVSRSFLGTVPVFLPSHEEQQRIVAFLDHETSKIDALIAEATHGISFLQERRSALISAAVTGKIDVRNLVQRTAA